MKVFYTTCIFYMNFEVVIAICTWIFLKMTLYLYQKTKYYQTLLVGSQVWYDLAIHNIEIKPVKFLRKSVKNDFWINYTGFLHRFYDFQFFMKFISFSTSTYHGLPQKRFLVNIFQFYRHDLPWSENSRSWNIIILHKLDNTK